MPLSPRTNRSVLLIIGAALSCSVALVAPAAAQEKVQPAGEVISGRMPQTGGSFPSDAEIRSLMEARITPGAGGMIVGVLEADGSTRVLTAGGAAPGGRPLGERSIFEIGSLTKVFTTTLLADMARRGEVRLSDPVSKYLPGGSKMPVQDGREITLLDLATHTSGLPMMPANLVIRDFSNLFAEYTEAHLHAFLESYTLPREIGAKFEYSNLGMGLLAHALSRAAGKEYETLVRERVLEPLGMHSTGIRMKGEHRDRMMAGYDEMGNVTGLIDVPTLAGAGALRSDVTDMLRFLKAQVGQPSSELERGMRTTHEPRTRVAERDSVRLSIGLGWHILSRGGSETFFHNGGTGGFQSFVGFAPDGRGVVVLASSRGDVTDLGLHLLDSRIPTGESPALAWPARAARFRYNRVEGLSLGVQHRADLGPAALHAEVLYGFADRTPRGEVALERWGSDLQSRLSAYRRLRHAGSRLAGPGALASAGALFLGRDETDYYDAGGVELRLRPSLAAAQWYDLRLYAERQAPVERNTSFSVARLAGFDARFPENFAAAAADQIGAGIRVRGALAPGAGATRVAATLSLGGEAGDYRFARSEARVRTGTLLPLRMTLDLEAAGGMVSGGRVPAQALWRLGGTSTLRGYPGGSIVGERYWRTRAELSYGFGRMGLVLFSDAGGSPGRERSTGESLVSVGAGARGPMGLGRIDLAHGLDAPGGWRLHVTADELLTSLVARQLLSSLFRR